MTHPHLAALYWNKTALGLCVVSSNTGETARLISAKIGLILLCDFAVLQLYINDIILKLTLCVLHLLLSPYKFIVMYCCFFSKSNTSSVTKNYACMYMAIHNDNIAI